MQTVAGKDKITDVLLQLRRKMVQRGAKLTDLVIPALIRTDGEVSARHRGGSARHRANRLCHPSRDEVGRNHHEHGSHERTQHQRSHKAHQRTIHLNRRTRHKDCACHALEVVDNRYADNNAVGRAPFGGNQLFAALDHLRAVVEDGLADVNLSSAALRRVSDERCLFVEDVDA
ncbi:hypothetical protein SDC9_90192 [bioreactor metagenome]|uniref:Uncharacterized protein n=1 Tax=bioreactor metagenome TaxID=1076179 RepID=A0A644ZRK6_9ZZZZ